MTAPGSAGPRNSIFPSIDVRLEQAEQEHLRGGRPVNAAVCRDARAELAALRAQTKGIRQLHEATGDMDPLAFIQRLQGDLDELRAQNERLREALDEAYSHGFKDGRDYEAMSTEEALTSGVAEMERRRTDLLNRLRALASTDTGETPNVR